MVNQRVQVAVEQKVAAAADLLDLQYNVYTSINCCRGIYIGLGVKPPTEMPNATRKNLTNGERIGIGFGRSMKLDFALMGGHGSDYLELFLDQFLPVALKRVQMFEGVREKNRLERLANKKEKKAKQAA